MKVILRIAHVDLLLPDDKGTAALMKTLSRAKRIRSDRNHYGAEGTVVTDGHVSLAMEYVHPLAKVTESLPAASSASSA